jgi:hypothetical protein
MGVAPGRLASRHGRNGTRRSGRDEGGYVLALSALLLVPLLLFTALAVDLGSWVAHASRAQAAADAAALAGVVHLPDRRDLAVATALATARKNGFVDGVGGVRVTPEPIASNVLRVSIFDPNVAQYFSSAFVEAPTITRGATAEYLQPVAMGSPDTLLGQDPERAEGNDGFDRRYAVNVAGVATRKENGDKRSAKNCRLSHAGCDPPDGDHHNNTDYSDDGYYFTVTIDESHPGGQPLRIEVYDPAYVHNGDGCDSNQLTASQVDQLAVRHPGDPFWSRRYGAGQSAWCTGDERLSERAGAGSSIVTTYIVRAPDDTPSDVTDNPAICAISFDPYGDPDHGSTGWIDPSRAGGTGIFDLLDSDEARGRENVRLRDHYRKWFPVCEIPAGSVETGTYVLQVRTNADLSNPRYSTSAGLVSGAGSLERAASPLPDTGGHNRYNLRAGFGPDLTLASATTYRGLAVSGRGHLPIFMNQLGAVAEFHLARITPELAGKTLVLTFWDMADVRGGTASVEVLSPPDATVPLDTCTFSRDGGPLVGATAHGCSISGITTGDYNGRNVVVRIPVPGGYDCAVDDPLGCWTKVRVDVSGGTRPADTTTWSATMLGDPVRLIR